MAKPKSARGPRILTKLPKSGYEYHPGEVQTPRPTMNDSLLGLASEPKLRQIIEILYRNNATVGDGGTADAIREEIKTGKPTRGKFHKQKGSDQINSLRKFLKRRDILMNDRVIADFLLTDLLDALGRK